MLPLRKQVKRIPIVGALARTIYQVFRSTKNNSHAFPGSKRYWEERYLSGGNSGAGSYDKFAAFKADFINGFMAKNKVDSVIEFGCGDGNQLALLNCPAYIGFDVSDAIIKACHDRFVGDASKTFKSTNDYDGETAELSLSLDVVYHLVEDDVFDRYMRTLFGSGTRYVIIYSSDSEDNRGFEGTWVKDRKFTRWIQENLPAWRLIDHVPNRYPYQGDYQKGSFSEFYVYEKV
jgi:SAM-dependent methyltransferase